ncbi:MULTISPECIES: thiamine phosphate synthase [Helcococcus]|uniref:Thiamine phosphate synthase n=1 Tax=Helcococcus bovis TaxID=3153252 RepID=A0ABW9F947_9FIRM
MKKYDIKKSLQFYAITDRKTENKEEFYKDVEIAINSGITMLQLREKNISENEFIEESKVIKKMFKEKGIKFIINDNYKISKLIDSDVVHIGQKDGDLYEIRKYLGKNKIIGVTAKNLIQAKLAQEG